MEINLELTIVAAEDEVIDGLQAEQRQEIPRKTRDPSNVQIPGANTGLEHRLELRRQWEG